MRLSALVALLLLASPCCSWPWDGFLPLDEKPSADLPRREHRPTDLPRSDGPADAARDRARDLLRDVSVTVCAFQGSDWEFGGTTPLNALNSTTPEQEPYLSGDGRTLYFTRGRVSDDTMVPWRATRKQGELDFHSAVKHTEIGTAIRFAVTRDDLTAFVVARKGYPGTGSSDYDLFWATRTNVTIDFAATSFKPLDISSESMSDWDVFPSADGSELFHATNDGRVWVARRKTMDSGALGAFVNPIEVAAAQVGTNANPAVTADGRVLFFSSDRNSSPKNADIWYSIRDKNGEFSQATRVPGDVNTAYTDSEPYIETTPDGCWLYFASTRGDGIQADLYRARYQRKQP